MTLDARDFYAALIHELKNDLGLLSMTIDSIPATGDAGHDRPVDLARLHCQHVVDRLQQTLLIYKASQKQFHPRIDAYSPHELMQAITARAQSLSHGRFSIELTVDPATPAIWFFDRDLIEMALINAVQNSLTYANAAIRLGLGMRDGYLALCVQDDSAGYPDHVLASVAANEPYRATGTGLGLQFSRLIAQSHDNQGRSGTLRLHNDSGAVFCLLIP
ncbi:MAG: HAMP domain-containing histidine kinase [Thiobacillus sp.]|nr:HAMP domain-containing histidine kinase [Thiobacillus sp.]